MGRAPSRTVAGLIGIWVALVAIAGSVSWVAITSVGQELGRAIGPDGRAIAAPSQLGPEPETSPPSMTPTIARSTPAPRPSTPAPTVTTTRVIPAAPGPTVTVTTRVTVAPPAAADGDGDRVTFATKGGSLTVRCSDGAPLLVGTRPRSGWSVRWERRDKRFYVRFRTSDDLVEVVIACQGDRPVRMG